MFFKVCFTFSFNKSLLEFQIQNQIINQFLDLIYIYELF